MARIGSRRQAAGLTAAGSAACKRVQDAVLREGSQTVRPQGPDKRTADGRRHQTREGSGESKPGGSPRRRRRRLDSGLRNQMLTDRGPSAARRQLCHVPWARRARARRPWLSCRPHGLTGRRSSGPSSSECQRGPPPPPAQRLLAAPRPAPGTGSAAMAAAAVSAGLVCCPGPGRSPHCTPPRCRRYVAAKGALKSARNGPRLQRLGRMRARAGVARIGSRRQAAGPRLMAAGLVVQDAVPREGRPQGPDKTTQIGHRQ
jgi:hypothetical protein